MSSILEQLYKGELYPYLTFQSTIEEFRQNKDKAFESYSTFLGKLPEELKDEFAHLIDFHLNLLPLELEQNFINGFCIGARMMGEIYSCPINETEN